MDVQINKLLHLSFLFSGQLGSSRGRVVYCQSPSNFVLQLYSFDSGYSLVVFGKDILSGGGERGSDNTFFPKITPLFHYHKNN